MEARVDVGEVDVVLDRRRPEGPSGGGLVQGPKIQRRRHRCRQFGQQQRHQLRRLRFDFSHGRDEIPGQNSRDGEGGVSAGNVGDGRNRNPFAHQCPERARFKASPPACPQRRRRPPPARDQCCRAPPRPAGHQRDQPLRHQRLDQRVSLRKANDRPNRSRSFLWWRGTTSSGAGQARHQR